MAEPISGILRVLVQEHPDWEDDKIAEEAIQSYATKRALGDAVWRLVTDEAVRTRRNMTRLEERDTFDRLAAQPITEDEARSSVPLRQCLVSVPGDVPVKVPWGQLTVEQHEAVIGRLSSMKHGLEQNIERHERAVVLIRAQGVERLDDIDGWEEQV